jgi:CheY-like chemotaxis protein
MTKIGKTRETWRKEMDKIKVAVIDDERDVVTFLKSALQDNGFDVYSASNANDGFEMICRELPNVVCIDILMPRETGYSLYRKIREDELLKHIPVIIITGLNIEHDSIRAATRGVADNNLEPAVYIEKPVNIPEFITAIRKVTA